MVTPNSLGSQEMFADFSVSLLIWKKKRFEAVLALCLQSNTQKKKWSRGDLLALNGTWFPVCVWQPCKRLSRVNLNWSPDEPPVTLNVTSGYKKSISHGLSPQYIPAISKRYLVSNATHVTPTSLKQMWWISWKEYLTSMLREQHCVSPLLRGLILSMLTDSSCNPIPHGS